jgi:ubiquinone/menaquinone biosynthesis C-methylase UbiE
MLPEGSTYTGVDSSFFLQKAKENLSSESYEVNLIESDLYSFKTTKKYDLAICQAALRHMNRPIDILHRMKDAVKTGGLVACVEVNREIENIGLYVDGMDYEELCTSFDWRSLWRKELECEGRDYAIGIRAPFYMNNIGLSNIQVRMNDCINYITPDCENYEQVKQEFASYRGWDHEIDDSNREQTIKFYMSRGIERAEVEKLMKFQEMMTRAFHDPQRQLSFLNVIGLMITCGRKQ